MPVEEIAGAPGVRVSNWNSAPMGGNNTTLDLPAGTLVNNNGNPINGLSMSLFTGNSGNAGSRGNPPGGVAPALQNDGRMFRTVSDKFEGNPGIIAITGIPYSKYQLYFYVYPDAGGGGERGGYFTVTNSSGVVQTRWLKGGTGVNSTIPLPDPATGDGYVQSKTDTQPTNFANIQAGHYVVLSGLTDPNIAIYYSAVGGGSGNVTGGDGVRRLKFSGFQIVETTSGTLTALSFASPIPTLYTGNPQGISVPLIGTYQDGTSTPLSQASGIVYSSSDTKIFTVNADGLLQPRNPGTAQLLINFQNLSLTQEITVTKPIAIRPAIPTNEILRGAMIQATLLADFPDGKTDVNVTAFNGVVFSSTSTGIVSVTTNGMVSAIAVGPFNLTATYGGVSGQTEDAGTVLPYDPPQPDKGLAFSFNLQAGSGMLFNDLAGAPGVRVGYWNNIAGLNSGQNTVTLTPGSIFDSSGRKSGGMSVSVKGGTSNGSSVRGTQLGNDSTMFNGVLDQFNGTPGSISITNIPLSSYDLYLYVYSGDANNRPGHFTLGNETRWILDTTDVPIPSNEGSGYVEAITTNTPTSIVEIQPGNYVKFSNLFASSLYIEFVADGANAIPDADPTAPRLKFAGFQLIGIMAPETKPLLTITRIDIENLRLSWPASAKGFVLKSSLTLNGTWSVLNTTYTLEGDTLSAVVPINSARTFYRLEKP